jgi:hypothetical protein
LEERFVAGWFIVEKLIEAPFSTADRAALRPEDNGPVTSVV